MGLEREPSSVSHLPWPEVLQRHVALLRSHRHFLAMICEESKGGNSSWDLSAAEKMFAQTQEMIATAVGMETTYVPPSHFRSKGPLGSAPVKFIPPVPVADPTTNGLGKEAEEPQRNGTSKTDVEENPYFRIDSKPTPVKGYAPQKRGDHSPGDTPTNAKRAKTEHDGPLLEKNFIEFEDISGEVDLRMLEKEKKREARKERKRKRESGASAEAAPTSNYAGGRHRQQKKKLKGISNNTDGEVNLKKRGQEAISEGGPPPFKKRKKGKKKGKGKA